MMRVVRFSGLSGVILVMTRVGCRLVYRLDERLRFPLSAMTILMILSLDESSLLLIFEWTGTASVWIKFYRLYLNKPVG